MKALYDNEVVDVDRQIEEDFGRAITLNRKIVEEFLRNSRLLPEDFRRLRNEEIVWRCERAVEECELAVQFEEAAASLQPLSETVGSVFTKSEAAFEMAYSTVFALPAISLDRIQKILTGQPLERSDAN